jgi:hypothetical protein
MSEDETGSESSAFPDDEAALHEPGIIRIIRLKPEVLPASGRSKPLTVDYVIKVATGDRARELDHAQTGAILDLLRWAVDQRSGKAGQQKE